MEQRSRIIIIVVGLVLGLLPNLIFIIISEEKIVGEQLCVDGNNNINLEGMMCEKTEFVTPGMSKIERRIIVISLTIIGLLIYTMGLFVKVSGDEQ